jgi:hypothetical protein
VLIELHETSQVSGEHRRRWFTDGSFDLIVWYDEDDRVHGFQLCYGKPDREHAVTWRRRGGYSHTSVDDGEGRPGKSKASPVLLPDGVFEKEAVVRSFRAAAAGLDPALADLVVRRLEDCP